MKSKAELKILPRHIAMIMDGNGRWAKARLLPRSAGYPAGVKTLERLIEAVFELDIPYLTIFAFSTENQGRPSEEIDGIVKLIPKYFKKALPNFLKKKCSIRIIGDRNYFSNNIREIIASAENQTAAFKDRAFTIALNYGARAEIVRAVNCAIEKGNPLSETEFASCLDTAGIPDPDIIIRTGGEHRLSNFLLYQAAYAELFFIPDLWPDFNKKRLHEILEEYGKRNRRFGK
ncbi:MAG: polyprenyl diphosphate synthase [Firmicutes bacterium]|nr:polyprenyl diphosphate synthase [Bacillota bacterium]